MGAGQLGQRRLVGHGQAVPHAPLFGAAFSSSLLSPLAPLAAAEAWAAGERHVPLAGAQADGSPLDV